MIILIGILIVTVSVFGGFVMGGGLMRTLLHYHELVIILGAAVGGLVIMSPRKVLRDIAGGLVTCLKGAPHTRQSYEELLKVLYELFLLGRRDGMIALEEHVMNPMASTVFQKYPSLLNHPERLEFLCNGLKPVIDGRSSRTSWRPSWARNWRPRRPKRTNRCMPCK